MVSKFVRPHNWMVDYADRLVRLHRLIAQDQGESQAADELRDEMDLPWRKMSQDEIRIVGELSVDLYTITDPTPNAEPLRPDFKSKINDALDRQDYERALHLVRDNAAQLDVSAAAFLRGVCWSGLGLNSAAAEFFLHAEHTNPGMPEARLCALSTLISGNREQEALHFAQQWAQESDDPSLVLKSSEVVFLNAIRLPEDKARPLYEQTITLADRAVKKYATGPSDAATDEQILVAILQIAVSYARLGDLPKAREFSARARKLSPNSVVAITVDGMINEAATPVGDAAKLEVARRIVSAAAEPSEAPPGLPIPQNPQLIREICALN